MAGGVAHGIAQTVTSVRRRPGSTMSIWISTRVIYAHGRGGLGTLPRFRQPRFWRHSPSRSRASSSW
eukprot:5035881-Pyramimonas_sp.AAC.1